MTKKKEIELARAYFDEVIYYKKVSEKAQSFRVGKKANKGQLTCPVLFGII